MSKTQLLPYDVKQECIWIIKGYERRKRAYKAACRECIDYTPDRYQTVTDPQNSSQTIRIYNSPGSQPGRAVEYRAFKLAELEEWPETQRLRAVERAIETIGAELPADMRRCLVRAIMLNFESGREYPYERLELPGIGRRDFYRRRDRFILEVAHNMKLV